ncbi:hypothetical protein CSKR_104099 [Clonorchis sinensis]|uniref:Uncharacterized protein n=1 Tax=Clonorchis sinensis TaxID=79923 RepID=A0A419QB55_CLOSI|nr:hypothetical protein CSKR_104099 [Clonorchis sinensis]
MACFHSPHGCAKWLSWEFGRMVYRARDQASTTCGVRLVHQLWASYICRKSFDLLQHYCFGVPTRQSSSTKLLTETSVVPVSSMHLDCSCPCFGNLTVSQPSYSLRLAWQLGTERTLPLALCRNATIQMVTLCEKSHTRLAPILRRSFCSRCYATIDTVNGRSLRFRRKRMLVTCSHCSEKSLLPIVHDVNSYCDEIVTSLHSAGNFACGKAPPGALKHWISDRTVALLKSRRNIPAGPEHNLVRRIIRRPAK